MQQLPLFPEDRMPFAAMRAALLPLFDSPRGFPRSDPLDQFVRALLGQRTLDAVSDAAQERLRARGWDAVMRADIDAVTRLIAPVTWPRRKAEVIQANLHRIHARFGRLSLDALADWPADCAVAYLAGFACFGHKSAAATVNFSRLRLRAFVADCHVLRIGERWGLLASRTDYDKGYETFMRALPPDWDAEDFFEFHWLLKRLGQTICTARAPKCALCPLVAFCPRGAATRGAASAAPTQAAQMRHEPAR